MTKPKFTPGPWEVKPEEVGKSYIRIRGTRLGRRFKIANVIHPDHQGATDSDAEETRANAHLIASAPDLYEALEDLLYQAKFSESEGGWDFKQARAALKKARGDE